MGSPEVLEAFMNSNRKGHSLLTYTGKQFYPADPRPEDICIDDIAQGLSNCCRFGGQVHEFYSVAQHSLLVSEEVARQGGSTREVFHALLHDASEAYIHDITWPLKHCDEMAGYRDIEKRVEAAIAVRYGLDDNMPEIVKLADNSLLATEKRDIVDRGENTSTEGWRQGNIAPLKCRIMPMNILAVRQSFLNQFARLSQLCC
jgi:hypothetical protein